MKTFEIKITGSGTQNQLATALLDLGRELQVKEAYYPDEDIEGEYENEILLIEIK